MGAGILHTAARGEAGGQLWAFALNEERGGTPGFAAGESGNTAPVMSHALRNRATPVASTMLSFQAEAGIRDTSVTGVQTCALPISSRQHHRHPVIGNCAGDENTIAALD